MTTTQNFPKDSTVTFRPEAGGSRVGVVHTVHKSDAGIDVSNGKQMVGLMLIANGRKSYRMAYVSDLVAV